MQTHRTLVALSLVPLAFAAAGVGAGELTKEQLASQLNGIDAKDISNSPLQGIYQVAVGSNVAYVTSDGRYIIRGDIYDAKSSTNLTEESRAKARVAMLKSVDPASMIVFKPAAGKPVKHTVTIFTDVDCGYCRQFHREIDKVTALAVSSNTRAPSLPDVPTTAEAGLPKAAYAFWNGVFVPTKTPPEVVKKLHDETQKAIADPGVKERLTKLAIEPLAMSQPEFDKYFRTDVTDTDALAKAAGIEKQ